MNLVMFSQKIKTQNLRLFEHDLQWELIRFGHMFRQGCQPQLPAVPRLETVETWGELGCFQEIYVENGMKMAFFLLWPKSSVVPGWSRTPMIQG